MATPICEVCGSPEGKKHKKDCPLTDKFSVWIYGPEIGWWLEENGYDNLDDAAASLVEAITFNADWTGGAVVPDGRFPMPMCEYCCSKPKVATKPKGKRKRRLS